MLFLILSLSARYLNLCELGAGGERGIREKLNILCFIFWFIRYRIFDFSYFFLIFLIFFFGLREME